MAAGHAQHQGGAYQTYLNSFNEGVPTLDTPRRQSLWQRLGHALLPRHEAPTPTGHCPPRTNA